VKRMPLFIVILGAALVLAPASFAVALSNGAVADDNAVPVQATSPGAIPSGVTSAEYHALVVRGEALNRQYGNAVTSLTPAQFKSIYLSGGDRMTPQELVALVERSKALDAMYGHSVAVAPSSSGTDVNWTNIGISALAGALLAAAAVTALRRRHQLGF
jgi:hypothetical protein